MFSWRRPNGTAPVRSCLEVLARLDKRELIRLPAPRRRIKPAKRRLPLLEDEFLLGPTPGVPTTLSADAPLLLRPIAGDERAGFQAYLQRYHYLGDSPLVGESLRYAAWLDGELVALLGWSMATLCNGPRDRYVGWDEAARRERLHLVANNARFLILPWIRQPNLASRILGQNLRRLSSDWEAKHGHPLLLAETFVDPSRFRGTCYQASNWVHVGETKGWSRRGKRYYQHGQPKAVFLFPLVRRACEALRAPVLPRRKQPEGRHVVELAIDRLPLEGEGGLFDAFKPITDKRKARGKRYPLQAILSIAACAVLAGQRSFEAIAQWAKDQAKEDLKRLGSRYGRAPSERTFRRVLKEELDAEEVDEKLGGWVAQHEGALKDMGVALDGKTLRGSRDGERKGVHLLSAVAHETGTVLAQTQVPGKTNEIKRVAPLLEDLDITGATVTADALLTQTEIARYIVEDKQADYLFTVKDNQPTLRKDIDDLFTAKTEEARRRKDAQGLTNEAFPPGARDGGQGPRSD